MLLSALLVVTLLRSATAVLDFADAIHYPFEIDYGEGIVWQQTALFGTDRMYARVTSFPFVNMNYPPVYLILVRVVAPWFTDLLEAGRAVSSAATLLLTALIAGCVWLSGSGTKPPWRVGIAVASGLTALCTANFWSWGLLMRVDILAITFSFAGLLIAHRARARPGLLLIALTLCSAAVFTKQLQFSAGLAVCLLAMIQRVRPAVACMIAVAAASVSVFAALQISTDGGFYQHIVSLNVHPLSWSYLYWVIEIERRDALILAAGLFAFIWVVLRLCPVSTLATRVQQHPPTASRLLAIFHYGISACTLPAALKLGSNANYFIEFIASGCVLTGIVCYDLVRSMEWRWLNYYLATLVIAPLLSPFRTMPGFALAHDVPAQWRIVEEMRQATAPVSSEDMTLLMRAGVPVQYEPALISYMTFAGRFDERPLLDLIERKAFAFMLTIDNRYTPVSARTPAVDAAMRAAYPLVEEAAPGLWINRPINTN